MCETWAKDKSSFSNSVDNYRAYSVVRPFQANLKGKGHGGSIAFVKSKLAKYVSVIPSQSCNVLWISIHRGVSKLLFGCVYFAPEYSTTEYSRELLFDILQQELIRIKSEQSPTETYICGDFNGRTAALSADTSDITIGTEVIYEGEITPPRSSQDKVINKRGKELLSFCSTSNMAIANGLVDQDENIGHFTYYVSNTGSSVVGYLLVENNSFKSVSYFEIGDQHESDHFPLLFNITNSDTTKINTNSLEELLNNKTTLAPKRIIWRENQSELFVNKLNSEHVSNQLSDITLLCRDLKLEDAATKLTNIMFHCADSMVLKSKTHVNKVKQPWYDKECKTCKQELNSRLRTIRNRRDKDSLSCYLSSKSAYKSLLNKKKLEYSKQLRNRLDMCIQNRSSRDFWNLIKPTSVKINSINTNEWFDYFSNLYNELHKLVPIPAALSRNNYLTQFQHILDSKFTESEIIQVMKKLKK